MALPLNFNVCGMHPSPPQGGDELAWRNKIAEKARTVHIEDYPQATETTCFRVFIEFLIKEPRLTKYKNRADIDNMAKPVIDTLFRSGKSKKAREPKPTAVLFDIDDKQVFELTMKKRLPDDKEEEGAIITITWD